MKISPVIVLSSALGSAILFGGYKVVNDTAHAIEDTKRKVVEAYADALVDTTVKVTAQVIDDAAKKAAKGVGEKLAEEIVIREFLPPELQDDFRKHMKEKHDNDEIEYKVEGSLGERNDFGSVIRKKK